MELQLWQGAVHRIPAAAPAGNPGSYVLGSILSSLKLHLDSKRISSHVETHSFDERYTKCLL